MLGVVQRAITNGSKHLSDDEERVAVQVICRRACHDHRSAQVEAGEDDRHDGTAEFVDGEAKRDA